MDDTPSYRERYYRLLGEVSPEVRTAYTYCICLHMVECGELRRLPDDDPDKASEDSMMALLVGSLVEIEGCRDPYWRHQ